LKLLFISPRFSGGIGGHAEMLANKLLEYGFEVKKMNVPHIPIKNLKNPSFTVLSSLKGMLSREQFDVVHGFNIPSAYATKYAKGKKKVLSVHGVFSEQINSLHSKSLSSLAKIAESQVLQWPDKLTTDSKATQKIYKEKTGLDFEYLPTPIDTTKFAEIPSVENIDNQVAFVGRNSYEKGIDILKTAESKIHGKVVYCTDRPWKDAMIIIKSSSVVVVPSRIESLPTIVKEAFYLKVPVVGTNVGGIPELIKDNVTGLLAPSNDPQKLADAINLLLDDKEKATICSNAAYEFIKNNLTWDVILPKYIEFYENLVKN